MSEPPPEQRPGYAEPNPFTELRRAVDSAAAPSRGAQPPLTQPHATSPPTAPGGDLVARALAILADEVEAWRLRRNAKDLRL